MDQTGPREGEASPEPAVIGKRVPLFAAHPRLPAKSRQKVLLGVPHQRESIGAPISQSSFVTAQKVCQRIESSSA
jgi:hypothetical protein